jgi:UDP:flavonoid glycosyltransferase YjiC (YdhE family)
LEFEHPGTLGRRAIHRFRYEPPPVTGTGLPAAWGDPEMPLAYVSFGTVAATLGLFPALYRALIDALADLPVRVLVTLGEAGDADVLAPLPGNTHVEQFWPQHEVMPHAAAVVGHGGFGTTMVALAAGVPQVVLPLFASDQRLNADAVARSGVGRVVGDTSGDAALPDPAALAAATPPALAAILDDPAYAGAAGSLAAAVAELPPPSASVTLVESLASRPGR